jgi:hypothetical protein
MMSSHCQEIPAVCSQFYLSIHEFRNSVAKGNYSARKNLVRILTSFESWDQWTIYLGSRLYPEMSVRGGER